MRVAKEWPENADPARVTLLLDLLPAEDVEPYLYTESRIVQDPGMRLSKEWPSDEITNATYIALNTNFYIYLESLAGGTP